MSYFIDWRDYVRQPRIKSLIESKGIEAARQEYIRESNKAMWDDPFVINETAYNSTDPTTAPAGGAGGSAAQITGHVAEVSTYTWAATVNSGITGSAGDGFHGRYFDVAAYNGTNDYSFNHVNSTKVFRFYFVSASAPVFTATNTNGIHGIVTASYSKSTEVGNITGSLLHKFKAAVASQAATATVAGFTNTIAPSTLFTATLNAGSSSLTLTHVNKGGVPDIVTPIASTTASVAVATLGLDKYYGSYISSSFQLFNGATYPYTSYARRV